MTSSDAIRPAFLLLALVWPVLSACVIAGVPEKLLARTSAAMAGIGLLLAAVPSTCPPLMADPMAYGARAVLTLTLLIASLTGSRHDSRQSRALMHIMAAAALWCVSCPNENGAAGLLCLAAFLAAMGVAGMRGGASAGWDVVRNALAGTIVILAGTFIQAATTGGPETEVAARLAAFLGVAGFAMIAGLAPLEEALARAHRQAPSCIAAVIDPFLAVPALLLMARLSGTADPVLMRALLALVGGTALLLDVSRIRAGDDRCGLRVHLALATLSLGLGPTGLLAACIWATGLALYAPLANHARAGATRIAIRLAIAIAPPMPGFSALVLTMAATATWSRPALVLLLVGLVIFGIRYRPLARETAQGTVADHDTMVRLIFCALMAAGGGWLLAFMLPRVMS